MFTTCVPTDGCLVYDVISNALCKNVRNLPHFLVFDPYYVAVQRNVEKGAL